MRESLAIAYCLQGQLDKAVSVLSDDIEAARSNPRDVAHEQLPKYAEIFGVPVSV
jgi:flagellar biosynthesis GTPase FlhF